MTFMPSFINILRKIYSWISSHKKETVIIILSAFLTYVVIDNRAMRYRYEKSITDISDTLSVYKTKNGDLRKSAESYVVSLADLKKRNTDLYEEVKNLKAKPLVVTKTEYVTEVDTLYLKSDSVKIVGGAAEFHWSHSDSWTSISGVSA